MKNHIKTIAVFCFALLVAACGSDEQKRFEQSTRMVRDVYVSTSMTVYAGQSYYIQGVGFEKGDLLSFRSDESEVEIPVQDATPKTACIIIPEALGKGTYRLWIERGEREQFLSVVKVYLTSHFDVPDKEGATIKGAVFCENRGIAGVRVSDGIVTAITDENGYYWLASDKSTGYVFYSMPSGYVPVDFDYDAMGFWQPLTADATVCEQHNFGMRAVDNDEFVLLLGADLHLANKQKDIENFKNGFVADSKRMAEQFSCPVYCLFAGDMTWDRYWYDNKFTIPTYKRLLQEVQYPLPVFHLMGNHDNDPYVTGDEAGQVPYRLSLGPNYYSFDLGEAHFVVLDDIDWINTGGAQGIVGARDYNRLVSLQQMEWLAADLAAVADKSAPLFIALHVQLYENYNAKFENKPKMSSATGGTQALVDAVAGFTDVHFLSGHTHYNATMEISERIMEHNHAAVCETWWWSQYLSDRAICVDGTPAGYGVYHVTGDDVKWIYKSIGEPENRQFRAYDMNTVKPVLGTEKAKADLAKYPSRKNGGDDYGAVGENVVFINVWNYDPQWTIRVTENGRELPVERVFQRDPLHSLVFDLPRVQKGYDATSDWASAETSHMFSVTASAPDTQIEISVTDRFGTTYTETMTRPKAFVKTMQ